MAKGKKEDIEDDYSAKLDLCLTDGIIKTGVTLQKQCNYNEFGVVWFVSMSALSINMLLFNFLVLFITLGSGIALGTLSSLLFLGRRRWPIIAGMGMGIGLAYANCEYELNPKKNNAA